MQFLIDKHNLSALDTSNVTNMASMFAECTSLTSLDFSGIDTSKVTNMSNMFADCTSLTSLDLSSFNTNSVTTMEDMFNNCSNLEHLSIHNFNTSNTEIMRFMFWRCDKLYNNIDLSSFDVSNVTSYDCFMNFGEKINGRPWEELFTDKNNSHANTEPTILATVTINSPISGCPELILSESYIYKGQSTYELSWKKFNDHSEYIVYVYERGNGNTTLLSQHHVTGLSYTLDISKFKAKGVYSVNISAGNAFSAPIIFMYT